jgi:dephospho-CoA kinase
MGESDRRWVLSGGIGSGKSAVLRLLDDRGIRTINADQVGHDVLDAEAFDMVSARWPHVVRGAGIDRSALARIVFSDATELSALEEITHPIIFGRIEVLLEGFADLAVVELPLSTGFEGWSRMVVDADDSMRTQRAVARGMLPGDVMARMQSQPSREEWLATADLVIPNHGTFEELEQTVDRAITAL